MGSGRVADESGNIAAAGSCRGYRFYRYFDRYDPDPGDILVQVF